MGQLAFLACLLLSVQRHHNGNQLSPCNIQYSLGLSDSGACGDHVVDKQTPPPSHVGADEVAALAVILGLLAVVGKANVHAVFGPESSADAGSERYALVGGAKDDVELHPGRSDARCVGGAELGLSATRVEEASVEEVRRGPTGLQRELPELQHLRGQRELDEVPLVRLQRPARRRLVSRSLLRLGLHARADLVDGVSELLGRLPTVQGSRDPAGDGQQEAVPVASDCRLATGLEITALCAHAGSEYPSVGVHPAHCLDCFGVRRPNNEPDVAVLVPLLAGHGERGYPLEDAAVVPDNPERLYLRGGRVRGLAEHEGSLRRAVLGRGVHKRREGVPAHVRRERDRVGVDLVER
mmetsp:Transcript_81541/g.243070  ORF Transcript_81541/g.243070 Transcript_81541/m.243070 type:complete len:353 (+) Transcript_81541:399-1457(+)